MPHKRHFTILLMMFVLVGLSSNIPQVRSITVWTAHVEWVGYDFENDNNCGDGYGQTCENKLKVKRTTSTSCSSRSWLTGSQKNNYPWESYNSGYYRLTWSRAGSAPCLTFDVRFEENSAGYSTNQYTFTISSSGSSTIKYLDLTLGSANGDFKIRYWLSSTSQYE